jgi:hypothetical protein
MLYTSQSRALFTAEIAVHSPLGNIPTDYEIIQINFPESINIKDLTVEDLPKDWKSIPQSSSTQKMGDDFLEEKKYVVVSVRTETPVFYKNSNFRYF